MPSSPSADRQIPAAEVGGDGISHKCGGAVVILLLVYAEQQYYQQVSIKGENNNPSVHCCT